jgi:hypothetical protein
MVHQVNVHPAYAEWQDLEKNIRAAFREHAALLDAAHDALTVLVGLSETMRERAKELEGENRVASELLAYYAPNLKGQAVKKLQKAIRMVEER